MTTSHMNLGIRTGFNPVTSTSNNNNKKRKVSKTRIIRISEELYQKFSSHSRRYYNVEPYETILLNLLETFEKHNQSDYSYHHLTTKNNDNDKLELNDGFCERLYKL